MVYINETKKTKQAIKIGICYNDENGFLAIQKIIMLLKYLNINATFTTISAGSDKYIKGCNNGIEEHDSIILKNVDLLLHTEFDMRFFNANLNHKDIKEYLDFALKIVSREKFILTNNLVFFSKTEETNFFKQHEPYIIDYKKNNNIDDNYKKKNNVKEKTVFSFGFGEKIICTVNNYSDYVVLNFVIELLKKIQCEETVKGFMQICNIFSFKYEKVLEHLKKIYNKTTHKYILADISCNLMNIQYKKNLLDNINNFPKELKNVSNQLNGLFEISKLVSAIKDRTIKIQDENLELFAIYSLEYEVYPNLFYWDRICVNPIVKLKEKDNK